MRSTGKEGKRHSTRTRSVIVPWYLVSFLLGIHELLTIWQKNEKKKKKKSEWRLPNLIFTSEVDQVRVFLRAPERSQNEFIFRLLCQWEYVSKISVIYGSNQFPELLPKKSLKQWKIPGSRLRYHLLVEHFPLFLSARKEHLKMNSMVTMPSRGRLDTIECT